MINAYRMAGTGNGPHLASVRQLDPPHHIWEGLQLYAHVDAKIRDNDRKQEQQQERQRNAAQKAAAAGKRATLLQG